MFKAAVSFAFSILLSQFANGQLITPTEEPVIVKKAPPVIEEDSSEHNRMGKTYEIGIMPFGFGPIPSTTAGFNVAAYLTRNSAVTLSYAQLTQGRSCWGSLTCSDKGYSIEVFYRQFVLNSFYFATGLDQRHVSVKGSDTYFMDEYSFDGDSTSWGLVVGNQWQWQNFYLGCDWIGINIPFASSFSNVKTPTYTYDFESAKKTYVTNTTGMLVRLHLGMTF